jgi:hypothetical protein
LYYGFGSFYWFQIIFSLSRYYIFLNLLSFWVSLVILLFSFLTLDSLLILCFSLVRPKLQYASVVWNSIAPTDAKKLERIQRKVLALCYNRFLSPDSNGYSYANDLQVLNLRTLHERKHQLDAIFVINVFLGFKSCPSTMDIIGLREPTRNLRDFPLFHVSSSYKNCLSGRCASAANSVCNQLDVFRRQIVTLRQMWYYFTTLLQGVLITYLSILLFVCRFWLCLFHLCPVHCPLLFVLVCCTVSVIGHLAVDSAH